MNLFLTNHNGGTSQEVACCYDAVFRQDKHRARTLYLLIHLINTLYKGVAHIDEQGHQLGLVDVVGRHLAQVHALFQQFFGYLVQVVNLGYRYHRIAPQMGVDDDRLWVGITDDTQSLMSLKLVQFVLETRTEIVALQRVDRTVETAFLIKRHQTSALCT